VLDEHTLEQMIKGQRSKEKPAQSRRTKAALASGNASRRSAVAAAERR